MIAVLYVKWEWTVNVKLNQFIWKAFTFAPNVVPMLYMLCFIWMLACKGAGNAHVDFGSIYILICWLYGLLELFLLQLQGLCSRGNKVLLIWEWFCNLKDKVQHFQNTFDFVHMSMSHEPIDEGVKN